MSEHWYDAFGSLIEGADLRMARERRLMPGVTSVIKMLANPGLQHYLFREMLASAEREPPKGPFESLEEWQLRVIQAFESRENEAAALGKLVHKMIEDHISEGVWDLSLLPEAMHPQMEELRSWFNDHGVQGETEKSIVGNGYAGTVDFLGMVDGRLTILDFKTQKPKLEAGRRWRLKTYDEHCIQQSAYKLAVDRLYQADARCINIYIPTTSDTPHLKIHEWPEYAKRGKTIEWGQTVFKDLLAVFYDVKKLQ